MKTLAAKMNLYEVTHVAKWQPLPAGFTTDNRQLPGFHGRVSVDCLHGSICHHQLAQV
jgi:hypothetical protein